MPRFGLPGERIGYMVYPHRAGGPPLVLVHGFTASSASFSANIERLNERFEVITIDLLGHGQSEAPAAAEAYGPGPTIDRILRLLDFLGHEQVLLCGHSLGAAVCLRLALDAPQRLAGLILINSMSAAGTPAWRLQARPAMTEMAARLRAEGSAFLRDTPLYPAKSRRLDPRSRELLTAAFDATDPNGLAGTADSLVIDINSYERLGELSVPTLLVVGDREKAFADIVPAFVGRMPEGMVREVHLPEAGHAANLEQPREFEDAVFAFAEDVGYGAAKPPLVESGDAPKPPSRFGGNALTVVGAGLVLAGVALLVGSFIFVRDGDKAGRVEAEAAQNEATRTPTVNAVAGTRSTAPSSSVSATATPGTPAATASPSAADSSITPAATATNPAAATPAATSTPQPTPTQPAAPTGTATAPAPTATPSGPLATVSGPGSAALNAPVTFQGSTSGGAVSLLRWSASGGSVLAANQYAPTVTFTQSGCQTVTVTVLFSSGVTRTASARVAVGGASCP